MLARKRPKEGMFTEREEEIINSSKDKCTQSLQLQAGNRWHEGNKTFLCQTWIGGGSDYTLEIMGTYEKILRLEMMWSCLFFRMGWIKE